MDEQPKVFYVGVRYRANRDGSMNRTSLAGAFCSWVSEAWAHEWVRMIGGQKQRDLRYEVWNLTGEQMQGLMLLGWKRGAIFRAKCEEVGIQL
jgi:hypothetical protein